MRIRRDSSLCRGCNTFQSIQGVCGTTNYILSYVHWIGAPYNEITYTCAGINHLAWYIKYEWKGKDAYPLIHKAVEKPEIYNKEIVRNELFKHLGYYVTESSGHNSEYNWWFRKRPELIEKYCTHGTNWNPGEYAFILKEYQSREKMWKEKVQGWLDKETP
ncbi:unnamed protein product, partial [marine sediment metagenome]